MKTKNKNQQRQGDILFEAVDPETRIGQPIEPEEGRIILARGEATGHHHSIDALAGEAWKLTGDDMIVEVKSDTDALHQEHGPISLPAGTYRITRQCEYSPEAIRNVAD